MRCARLDMLRDPFAGRVMMLIELMEAEGIAMVPFETHRSLQRQAYLYAKGRDDDGNEVRPREVVTNANPGESAHNWGIACDFVLDVDVINVRMREWRGKLYPDAWDVITPEAAETWRKFGKAVESCGLVWGGRWRRPDRPHVELPRWEAHRPADWRLVVRRTVGPVV
jgi:peptidoglycan L-alanyl-D-glutamate endopeptidase CwlK